MGRHPAVTLASGRRRQAQAFCVVVANPPFSLDKWGQESAANDKFGRFRRGLPPRTKGDYAFILHMIEVMKPAVGRMAVVAPHGCVFRGAAEGKNSHQTYWQKISFDGR